MEYVGVYRGGVTAETMTLGEFPIYGALIMLFIDCLIYLLLAVYFDMAIGGLSATFLCSELTHVACVRNLKK